ncbi:MAG: hypothetical protein LBE02_08030 [Spirochaetaceae bacterium]|jgi:hypothetical protein|nr:hypothetical protein [Spirochaetaceae bacterium]
MAVDFLELAKKVREVLSTRHTGEDIRSLVAAANYVVLTPNERKDILRKEILAGMMEDIKESGYFKPEKFLHMEKIIPKIGGYFTDPFSYNDCLSDEEKEARHINPEFKISREMADCMTEKALAEKDPRHIVPIIYYMNLFNISRKYKLMELRARGVVKIKIVSMGGELDCEEIKNHTGIYSINDPPTLPLPNCGAAYCRCDFEAYEEETGEA